MTAFHDKMIERVARAICLSKGLNPEKNQLRPTSTRCGLEPIQNIALHEPQARAAIRAVLARLREPSTEMQRAGINAVLKQRSEYAGGCFSRNSSCEQGHCRCWNVGERDWQDSFLATLDAVDPDKETDDVAAD